ncbi:unnamed protein product [Caretta caretta]
MENEKFPPEADYDVSQATRSDDIWWSKLEFTTDARKLHSVPLGQGQEAEAEIAMVKASKEGHWVILQNLLDQCICEQEFKIILFFTLLLSCLCG